MKIHLTNFARHRHFDPDTPGTTITDRDGDQFEHEVHTLNTHFKVRAGYADFCHLLFVRNWTNAKVGTLKITPENEKYLKSGYKARNDNELPVLSRWFEGITPPKADYLCIVVYSKEQLLKEGTKIPDDCDFGIVAILGQSHDNEEPMPPVTMMRNALGVEEGGSGHPLNREQYKQSVEFWSQHATIRG